MKMRATHAQFAKLESSDTKCLQNTCHDQAILKISRFIIRNLPKFSERALLVFFFGSLIVQNLYSSSESGVNTIASKMSRSARAHHKFKDEKKCYQTVFHVF